MASDFINRIHKSQEAGNTPAAAGPLVHLAQGDPALARLRGLTDANGMPMVLDDGASISSELADDLLFEMEEMEMAKSTTSRFRTPFTRPQVTKALVVGGMLMGCAAGAFALGGAGFFLALAAEALAFAGGFMANKGALEELEEENRKLREKASKDPLIGINNRGAIDEILNEQLMRAPYRKGSVSVILGDVDHFKSVNDTYGHQVGDEVLIEVAQRIKAALRSEDSMGRYGGEEFLVVLPGISGTQAVLIGHRIRLFVAQEPFETEAGELSVTMSLGVASTDFPELFGAELLVRAADEALYQAKHEGRNRVIMAPALAGR